MLLSQNNKTMGNVLLAKTFRSNKIVTSTTKQSISLNWHLNCIYNLNNKCCF